MKKKYVSGEYYYGNKISDYGIEHNRVDYGTLAKAFDAVLNNSIYDSLFAAGYYWEPYSESSGYYYEDADGTCYTPEERDDRIEELENELDELDAQADATRIAEINADIDALQSEYYEDIFQYYIISEQGARILTEDTDEIVLYNEECDIYLWCVTHYGTAWDYVLTNIVCNAGYDYLEKEA